LYRLLQIHLPTLVAGLAECTAEPKVHDISLWLSPARRHFRLSLDGSDRFDVPDVRWDVQMAQLRAPGRYRLLS
jgi:hypothetical protein